MKLPSAYPVFDLTFQIPPPYLFGNWGAEGGLCASLLPHCANCSMFGPCASANMHE